MSTWWKDNGRFPVLKQSSKKLMPRSVAWALVEPWRAQIERNHSQTLDELAGRGGLSPEELWCAAHRLGLRGIGDVMEQMAIDWLIQISGEMELR